MTNERRTSAPPAPAPGGDEGPVPVFRSWRTWYAVILGELLFLIVLFRLITVAFR